MRTCKIRSEKCMHTWIHVNMPRVDLVATLAYLKEFNKSTRI